MPSILLIGVDTEFRKSLKRQFKDRFQLFSSGSLKEGIRNIQKNPIDIVVVKIDPKFLKSAGWLTKITKNKNTQSGELSVLFVADPKYALNKAFQELCEHPLVQDIYWTQNQQEGSGSDDLFLNTLVIFLEKNLKMLLYKRAATRNALKVEMLKEENKIYDDKTATESPGPRGTKAPSSFITGFSEDLALFRGELETLAKNARPILLSGPEGLEQSEIAGFIHNQVARRAKHHFGEIDLSVTPGHLQDSILFGLEEKNLPGFLDSGKGLFEKCRNGTVFIHHIEKLNWETQSKLLGLLGDGYFMRSGEKINIKCKTIITTEADLEKLVDRGVFRQNLHSHLASVTLNIPNLIQRRPDLPQVIDHYARWFSEKFSKPLEVSPQFKSELSRKRLPGQINEFKALLHAAFSLATDTVGSDLIVLAEDLLQKEPSQHKEHSVATRTSGVRPFPELPGFLRENQTQKSMPLFQSLAPEKSHYSLEELEREYINITLRQNHHNISETARVLGISRKTLYKKIKEYKITKNAAS